MKKYLIISLLALFGLSYADGVSGIGKWTQGIDKATSTLDTAKDAIDRTADALGKAAETFKGKSKNNKDNSDSSSKDDNQQDQTTNQNESNTSKSEEKSSVDTKDLCANIKKGDDFSKLNIDPSKTVSVDNGEPADTGKKSYRVLRSSVDDYCTVNVDKNNKVLSVSNDK